MITTQDNLANALAEGRITQEEYNEYYPYDGLESSYYSVFVETDLNIASTTSGQPLRSEDAIATYIADMLLWKVIRCSMWYMRVCTPEMELTSMSSDVSDNK